MDHLLNVVNVSVSLQKHEILHDISFSLDPGSILMLVGPNGAGKSTLLSAISGSLPFEGSVEIKGKNIRSLSRQQIARSMGLLMQRNSGSFDYTVEDIVRLGRYASRTHPFSRSGSSDEKVLQAMEITGVDSLRSHSMRTLSGGELQRAFLAQVFAQDPDILLLDEPANHLDFLYQKDIFALIDRWRREPSKAVLCVVHDLALARKYADRVLLLHHGQCAALGTPASVFTRDRLQEIYGMDVHAWMQALYAKWEVPDPEL